MGNGPKYNEINNNNKNAFLYIPQKFGFLLCFRLDFDMTIA